MSHYIYQSNLWISLWRWYNNNRRYQSYFKPLVIYWWCSLHKCCLSCFWYEIYLCYCTEDSRIRRYIESSNWWKWNFIKENCPIHSILWLVESKYLVRWFPSSKWRLCLHSQRNELDCWFWQSWSVKSSCCWRITYFLTWQWSNPSENIWCWVHSRPYGRSSSNWNWS